MAVNEKAELPPVKVIREVMDKRTAAQICQWRAEREGRGEIARAILAEGADPQAVTRDIAGLLKAVASHPPYEPGQKTVSMRSPLSGWLGGKFLLSKRLVALLPRHVCYVEPFSGAAWLLFRKRRSPVEVINDINRDIVALYRTVRDNPCYIREQVRWSLHSRQLFEEALMADTDRMSEAERAWRFLYLLKGSFGGGRGLGDWSGGNERISQEMRRQKLAAGNAGAPQACSTGGAPSITFGSTKQANDCPLDLISSGVNACGRDLPDFVERLKRVIIEHLPYAEVFARYDSPDTFFYVDPPYVDREDYYGKGRFSPDDFAKLRDILAGLKGKFILSLNDHPKAREIFGEFRMETGETTYGLNNVRPTKATELLFMNYDPASACQLAPAPEENAPAPQGNAPAPRRKRKKYYEPNQAPLLFSGLSASSTGKQP